MPDLRLVETQQPKPQVAEFFAGIGLVRMGLQNAGFEVSWSNDIEVDKRDLFVNHFGPADALNGREHDFTLGDVGEVTAADMPAELSLAWASFPCTDLSVAGSRAGLVGAESGTFWEFARILRELKDDGRAPATVALENVVGLATSHGGDDLAAIVRELNSLDYSVDVLTLDARRFVPQSRPRLFIVGTVDNPSFELTPGLVEQVGPDAILRPEWLNGVFQDPTLRTHRATLPAPPKPLLGGFTDLAETLPAEDVRWWDSARTAAFIESLSPIQHARIEVLKLSGELVRRTAYRRTRKGVPVWEVRPDDIAGCLRTARGGSSKQAVVELHAGSLRVRWMTALEYARLMGAGDYQLDGVRESKAMFGFGDAVCVPAVSWLAENYLMPAVRAAESSQKWTPQIVERQAGGR